MDYIAEIASPQLVEGFGLPAAIVIGAQVVVIIALVRYIVMLLKLLDDKQEKRIIEALNILNVINALKVPLDKQAATTEKTYELLLTNPNKRDS